MAVINYMIDILYIISSIRINWPPLISKVFVATAVLNFDIQIFYPDCTKVFFPQEKSFDCPHLPPGNLQKFSDQAGSHTFAPAHLLVHPRALLPPACVRPCHLWKSQCCSASPHWWRLRQNSHPSPFQRVSRLSISALSGLLCVSYSFSFHSVLLFPRVSSFP